MSSKILSHSTVQVKFFLFATINISPFTYTEQVNDPHISQAWKYIKLYGKSQYKGVKLTCQLKLMVSNLRIQAYNSARNVNDRRAELKPYASCFI